MLGGVVCCYGGGFFSSFVSLICILCVPFYIFLQAILYMFFKRETFPLENGALGKGQLFAWREERGRWAGGLGCD